MVVESNRFCDGQLSEVQQYLVSSVCDHGRCALIVSLLTEYRMYARSHTVYSLFCRLVARAMSTESFVSLSNPPDRIFAHHVDYDNAPSFSHILCDIPDLLSNDKLNHPAPTIWSPDDD